MKSRVYTNGTLGLANFISDISNKLEVHLDIEDNCLARIGEKEATRYRCTYTDAELNVVPIYSVIYKEEGESTVTILIPESKINFNMLYKDYPNGSKLCFTFKIKQKKFILKYNFALLTDDFYKMEKTLENIVANYLQESIQNILEGNVVDVKNDWKLKGKIDEFYVVSSVFL